MPNKATLRIVLEYEDGYQYSTSRDIDFSEALKTNDTFVSDLIRPVIHAVEDAAAKLSIPPARWKEDC